MKYLCSERFNAKTMMGSLPIQHYLNAAIDNHIKDIKKIKNKESDIKPLHVNFL